MLKKLAPFIVAIVAVLSLAALSNFDGFILLNGEVVNNVTNGVVNFATHKDSVGNANLSGTRFMMVVPNGTATGAFILGDTTSGKQFIPLQDVRLTKMTIFGDAMASGDTVIVNLYKRAGASAPTVIATDSLTDTEMNESITFATNLDVSASHGIAIKKSTAGSPGTAVIILEGVYYDVR